MNIKDKQGRQHWILEMGHYDITQHKRRLAVCVVPDDGRDIPDSETANLYHWLLNGPEGARFDEQLYDPRQIISVSKEIWRAFPDRQLKITYEIVYDPYWKPGWIPGKCEN